MKPSVSIIVAAYNEDKNISRALESLVNQTLRSIEIIVIDDGSSDNTWKICQQYQKLYNNVYAYHEKNKGQGLAREYGISLSHGEYIGFTDADDWVESNMYKEMYDFAKDNNEEVVACDVHKIWKETGKETKIHSMPHTSSHIDVGKYIKEGIDNAYLHNKIWKRNIWSKYHFKDMVYEDLDISLTILSNIKKMGYIQKAFYVYNKHSNSTTTSYNNPRLFDIFNAYYDILKTINPKYYDEAIYQITTRILRNMDTPGFIYYKADFIELIKKISSSFSNNKEICDDLKNSRIFYLLRKKTLPNILISNNTLNSSWIKMGNNPYVYVEENIKKTLLFLYQHGGIFIHGDIIINSPYDYLRSETQSIYFDNNNYMIAANKFSPLTFYILDKLNSGINLKKIMNEVISNDTVNCLNSDTKIFNKNNIKHYLKIIS